MIKYSQPSISSDDIEAVTAVLSSGSLTQSEVVTSFEKKVGQFIGSDFPVKAVSSATSALETVYRALGVTKGSTVWTTPITFVATANAAIILGANVEFIDIDPNTYNICSKDLQNKLVEAAKNGKLPDVVVPVHLAGEPCDMMSIHELAKKYGFLVVEDASHAFGSEYHNTNIGEMQYSDAVVFSHHAIKNLTTGEGGSFLIKDHKRFCQASLFTSHGVSKSEPDLRSMDIPHFYYCQTQLGTNHRMTALQAALGLSQLAKFRELQARREFVTRFYMENLTSKYQKKDWPNSKSANHLFIIEFKDKDERNAGWSHLRRNGIETNLHYWPVHKQPFHFLENRNPLPNAEHYGHTALSIPCHPSLSTSDLHFIVEQVNSVCT